MVLMKTRLVMKEALIQVPSIMPLRCAARRNISYNQIKQSTELIRFYRPPEVKERPPRACNNRHDLITPRYGRYLPYQIPQAIWGQKDPVSEEYITTI